MIWIGADPGGKGKFGIAALLEDGQVMTACADCADGAVNFLIKNIDQKPAGIGVDAPLWWSSGKSGDRQADKWLRRRYGLSGGQVQTNNSLRGAALVQAAMFVKRVREYYPTVPVTEVHPKALLKAIAAGDWRIFANRFGLNSDVFPESKCAEHKRDALISAVAAREGFQKRWLHDLSLNRDKCEQNPHSYWLAPVHYFWPEK